MKMHRRTAGAAALAATLLLGGVAAPVAEGETGKEEKKAKQPLLRPASVPAEMERLGFLVGAWESSTDFYDREGRVSRRLTEEDFRAMLDGAAYEVRPILGGLVLEAGDGTGLARTWYLYQPLEERYFWAAVDFQGNFDVMDGSFHDGRLVFTMISPRKWRDGGTILWRRTYEDIEADRHQVLMEYSRDGGKTWTLSNKQHYRRAGSE